MKSAKNLCEKKVLFQEHMHSLTSVSDEGGRFPPQFFEKKLIQGGLKNDNPFSLKNSLIIIFPRVRRLSTRVQDKVSILLTRLSLVK